MTWDQWETKIGKVLDQKLRIEEEIEEIESDLDIAQSEEAELIEELRELKAIESALSKARSEIAKLKAKLKQAEQQWKDLDKEDQRLSDQEPNK